MSEDVVRTIGTTLTGILRYKLTEGWVTLSTLYQELKGKRSVTELELDDTKFVEFVIFEIHNKTSVRFIEGQYVEVFKYQIKRLDTDTDTLVKLHPACQTSRAKSRRVK